MRNSTKKRLESAIELVKEFDVSGVIWYELANCETYDSESYYFTRQFEELKIPILVLESEYGIANEGQLRTRVQAFIEIVKGV